MGTLPCRGNSDINTLSRFFHRMYSNRCIRHFMYIEKFSLHGLILFHFKFNVLFTTIGRTPEPRTRQK